MKEWNKEVLAQLDEAAKNYWFPTFDNVNFPAAGMRLFSYRDEEQWLLVFETIEYSVDERMFWNTCSVFGNDVDRRRVELDILCLPPDQGTQDDDIERLLQQKEITLMIRDKAVKVTLDKADLENAKLSQDPSMRPLLKLLRLVTSKIPEQLFGTSEQIAARCRHSGLAEFLTIKEWNHPNVTGVKMELPSKNKCFQSLARALSLNDKRAYSCPGPINSYWHFWKQC